MGLFSAIKGKAKPLMQIDTTLTESGQAADAKAAGDEFKKVTNSVQDVKTELSNVKTELSDFKTKLSQDYRIVEIDGVEVKEWINPPMQEGEEYRLTERFFGKPVYARAFVFVGNDSVTMNDFGIDLFVEWKACAIEHRDDGYNLVSLFPNYDVILQVELEEGEITINTNGDLSQNYDTCTIYAVIKYTKTTD